jgi:hypothetical protein
MKMAHEEAINLSAVAEIEMEALDDGPARTSEAVTKAFKSYECVLHKALEVQGNGFGAEQIMAIVVADYNLEAMDLLRSQTLTATYSTPFNTEVEMQVPAEVEEERSDAGDQPANSKKRRLND